MSVVKTVLIKDADTLPIYVYPKTSADMVEYENGTVQDKLDKIKADVPSNAKFTDTTYVNATSTKDGLMSKEDKEKIDKYIKVPQVDGDFGLISYNEKEKINSIHNSSKESSGLMTVEQFEKLESVEDGATKIIVDESISKSSKNPLTNSAIYYQLKKKADLNHTHEIDQTKILYNEIYGKEAIEVSNLNACFFTGLYYQTDTLKINNISLSKGDYICQVLSDKSSGSGFGVGNIIQIVYHISDSDILNTYSRLITTNGKIEEVKIGKWSYSKYNSVSNVILEENKLKIVMQNEEVKTIDLSSKILTKEQINKLNSIPSNAKFTDTTYSKVTSTKDGLMSKEDKKSFDIINNNSSKTVIDFTNDLSVDYNSLDELELGNNLTINKSLAIDKKNSLCLAKVVNGICTLNMALKLYNTDSKLTFNFLPTISGIPYLPIYPGEQNVVYFDVMCNREIKQGSDIIKPIMYLPTNSDDKTTNKSKSLYWAYINPNNVLKSNYRKNELTDNGKKSTSSVLSITNGGIMIYINSSYIIGETI